MVVAISGLAALAVGEITRRRSYDIVAKGVTALGFGLLYAAVFAAYRLYGIIDVYPAFGLAQRIAIQSIIILTLLPQLLHLMQVLMDRF